jgi:hypothetical protein
LGLRNNVEGPKTKNRLSSFYSAIVVYALTSPKNKIYIYIERERERERERVKV